MDPEIIWSGDEASVVIDVRLDTETDSHGAVTCCGPYVQPGVELGALVLQWGVISARDAFLLLHAAHLQLPELAMVHTPNFDRLELQATLALTDPRGGPLRGIVPPDRICWNLAQRPVTARHVAGG